jgi:hypothetical protein
MNGSGVTKARRVELLKGDDFKCALLGSLGFSTKFIMEHTEFSPSQIGYRLRMGGIRRLDYRNGESTIASSILRGARAIAIPIVKSKLLDAIKTRGLE